MRFLCTLGAMLAGAVFAGEILYQDYLGEDELLTAQDRASSAMINTAFDWNYFFSSNSLSIAMKIQYDMEEAKNARFRPIIVRYDFNGIRESVRKSVCRADTYYQYLMPIGFCMIGLDSFLFSYGPKKSPHTACMQLSDSGQTVRDITQDVNGGVIYGALSTAERAVFPDERGFVFQCLRNTNRWDMLYWNNDSCSLWPVQTNLKGYSCLSGRRVVLNRIDDSKGRIFNLRSRHAESRHVSSCCSERNCTQTNLWSVALCGIKNVSYDNEVGPEVVEGVDVIYSFYRWQISRIRRSDLSQQVFDLKDYFREEIESSKDCVALPILHRGTSSWYYALLFEKANQVDRNHWHYQMKIMEVLHNGEGFYIWEFPSFHTPKKLTTYMLRSPGVVHKLPDDSWVFLSNTESFTNDVISVQRMTGTRREVKPNFKAASWGKL